MAVPSCPSRRANQIMWSSLLALMGHVGSLPARQHGAWQLCGGLLVQVEVLTHTCRCALRVATSLLLRCTSAMMRSVMAAAALLSCTATSIAHKGALPTCHTAKMTLRMAHVQ